jgi:hypothetical protein
LEYVGKHWQDPRSRWHQAALALAEGLRLSRSMLSWGLRDGCSRWTQRGFLSLLSRELGRTGGWLAPELCGMVLASTVPPAGLLAPCFPLLLGSPVLLRPAQGWEPLLALFRTSLLELAPTLGTALELLSFPSADESASRRMSAQVELMVVHGSSDAVAAWTRYLSPSQRLVAYGPRLSAGLIDLGPSSAQPLSTLIKGLALDLCAWDQAGCLSPRCVFVRGEDAQREAFAAALLGQVERRERRWPMAQPTLEEAATLYSARRSLQLEGQSWSSGGGSMLVLLDEDGVVEGGPGWRTLVLRPWTDALSWEERFAPINGHLQCLACAGVEPETLAGRLARFGLNRLCRFGHMQRPPLQWRHDGIGSLAPLVLWVDRG